MTRCQYTGLSIKDCKSSDLCDCFDYPEHEQREPDDEDRAELADLLGADMVGKLLDGEVGN